MDHFIEKFFFLLCIGIKVSHTAVHVSIQRSEPMYFKIIKTIIKFTTDLFVGIME